MKEDRKSQKSKERRIQECQAGAILETKLELDVPDEETEEAKEELEEGDRILATWLETEVMDVQAMGNFLQKLAKASH